MRWGVLVLLMGICACARTQAAPQIDIRLCAPLQTLDGATPRGAEDVVAIASGMLLSFDDRRGDTRGAIRLLTDVDVAARLSGDLTQGIPENFHPHGMGVFIDDSGATTLMVVNHAEGWEGAHSSVEIYSIEADSSLTHRESVILEGFSRLNDVTPVSSRAFYATNETSAARSSWRNVADFLFKRGDGALVFYDGVTAHVIAGDFAFANSVERIGADSVAATDSIRGEVRVFFGDLAEGTLAPGAVFDVGAGPDNLIAAGGRLLIARHDNLQHFAQYARGKRTQSPWSIAELTPSIEGGALRVRGGDDGAGVSAIAIAAPTPDGRLFLGSVFDAAYVCPAEALPDS